MQNNVDGASVLTAVTELLKKKLRKVHVKLWSALVMGKEEEITRVLEEGIVGGILQRLEDILNTVEKSTQIVPVESVEMYEVIAGIELDTLPENNALVNTKYNIIDKKVKLVAGPLPANNERKERNFRTTHHIRSL